MLMENRAVTVVFLALDDLILDPASPKGAAGMGTHRRGSWGTPAGHARAGPVAGAGGGPGGGSGSDAERGAALLESQELGPLARVQGAFEIIQRTLADHEGRIVQVRSLGCRI